MSLIFDSSYNRFREHFRAYMPFSKKINVLRGAYTAKTNIKCEMKILLQASFGRITDDLLCVLPYTRFSMRNVQITKKIQFLHEALFVYWSLMTNVWGGCVTAQSQFRASCGNWIFCLIRPKIASQIANDGL